MYQRPDLLPPRTFVIASEPSLYGGRDELTSYLQVQDCSKRLLTGTAGVARAPIIAPANQARGTQDGSVVTHEMEERKNSLASGESGPGSN